MKILIGTPIHEVKNYAMERWLENVAKLQIEYPADLLMVDNSPGFDYVEKVKGYCEKYGVKNYRIEHLELPKEQEVFERVARSREIIRHEVLSGGYDAWFSWECDQLIPKNSLGKLVKIIKSGNFVIVEVNSWAREVPNEPNTDGGVSLFKREILEKYSFILEFRNAPGEPNDWETGEARFREQAVKNGGGYVKVYGVITPIYHLDK